jgi:hypothetical protein
MLLGEGLEGILLAIKRVHTFLAHLHNGFAIAPQIGGTQVALSGKLFRLLDNVFSNSGRELIVFNPKPGGTLGNACRDLVVDHMRAPTLPFGRRTE